MRGEILDGPERRRRWSEEEKTTILAELAKPGMRGTEVARRHGVSSGLLYTWRKERRAAAAVSATEMPFAPVLLTGPAQPPSTATTAEAQFIEIEVKGARESWLGKFAQRDKWRFCLTAARMAA